MSFRNENSLRSIEENQLTQTQNLPTQTCLRSAEMCDVITKLWPDRRAFTGATVFTALKTTIDISNGFSGTL